MLITEDTPLARRLSAEMTVRFVPHFAWGQRQKKSPLGMARLLTANARASFQAMSGLRPDLVLTTGAGSVFVAASIARARGASVALVESMARLTRPSLFGRLLAPFSDCVVARSEPVARALGTSDWFDPLGGGRPRPAKTASAVLTVGTVLPFDRLVGGVDRLRREGLLPEPLVAQVGQGGLKPRGMDAVEFLASAELQRRLKEADILFTHGGVGSVLEGLGAGCRVVAMPRDPRRGEHYDDHQSDIVSALEARGLIAVAREPEDLPLALEKARRLDVRCMDEEWTPIVRRLEAWKAPALGERGKAVAATARG